MIDSPNLKAVEYSNTEPQSAQKNFRTHIAEELRVGFADNKSIFEVLRWANVFLGVLLANIIIFYIALFTFKLKRSFDGIAGPDLDQVYYQLLRVEYQVFWGCVPVLFVTLAVALYRFYKRSKSPELTRKWVLRTSLVSALLIAATFGLGTHIYKFLNIHFRMNSYPLAEEFKWIQWEYSPLTGSEYALYGPTTWGGRHLADAEEGGHLVVIDSQAELDYLLDTYAVEGPVWIGLARHVHTGEQWLWSDGSSQIFDDWERGLNRYRGRYAFLIIDRDRSQLTVDAGPIGYLGYSLLEREVADP